MTWARLYPPPHSLAYVGVPASWSLRKSPPPVQAECPGLCIGVCREGSGPKCLGCSDAHLPGLDGHSWVGAWCEPADPGSSLFPRGLSSRVSHVEARGKAALLEDSVPAGGTGQRCDTASQTIRNLPPAPAPGRTLLLLPGGIRTLWELHSPTLTGPLSFNYPSGPTRGYLY